MTETYLSHSRDAAGSAASSALTCPECGDPIAYLKRGGTVAVCARGSDHDTRALRALLGARQETSRA